MSKARAFSVRSYRLLLHLGRLGRDVDQVLRHVRRECFVLRKKKIQCLAVELSRLVVGAEVGNVVAALLKILIARRALLTVPALFVGQFNRCKDRQSLDCQCDMCQISDRAVTVLKIKRIEKLFRFLRTDFAQRLLIDKAEREYFAIA